jgi:ABC-type transporter MlaC component
MSTAKGLHSSRLHPQLDVTLAIAFAIIALVAQPLTAASGAAPLTLVNQLVAQVLGIVQDKQMAQRTSRKNCANWAPRTSTSMRCRVWEWAGLGGR